MGRSACARCASPRFVPARAAAGTEPQSSALPTELHPPPCPWVAAQAGLETGAPGGNRTPDRRIRNAPPAPDGDTRPVKSYALLGLGVQRDTTEAANSPHSGTTSGRISSEAQRNQGPDRGSAKSAW